MALVSPLTSCIHSPDIILPSLIEQRTGELSTNGLSDSRSNNFKRKLVKSNVSSLQSKNKSRIEKKRILKHKSETISSIKQRSSRIRSSPRGQQSIISNHSIDYASFYRLTSNPNRKHSSVIHEVCTLLLLRFSHSNRTYSKYLGCYVQRKSCR